MKTSKRKSYTGQTFGRWYVAGDAPDIDSRRYAVCTCRCGVTRTILLDHVVSGKSKSCGCLRKERQRSNLGITRISWTTVEIKVIREHYPVGGAEAVAKFLPNRTINSIKLKASNIGVKYIREKVSNEN